MKMMKWLNKYKVKTESEYHKKYCSQLYIYLIYWNILINRNEKQMNVNENLLQLALKESQDTNMYKLSFDSNIIWKIS